MARTVRSGIGMKKKGVLLERCKFGLYVEQIMNCDVSNRWDILKGELNLNGVDVEEYGNYTTLLQQYPKFFKSTITFDRLKKNSKYYLHWLNSEVAKAYQREDKRSTAYWKH